MPTFPDLHDQTKGFDYIMILPCSGDNTPGDDTNTSISDADALALINQALQPVSLPAYFSKGEFLDELECRFSMVALRLMGGAA